MSTFYMMCGPAGCGKSYRATAITQCFTNIVYISSDKIRKELLGSESDQRKGGLIFLTAKQRIVENLRGGRDVLFDATNLKAAQRKRFIKLSRDAGAKFCICLAFYCDEVASRNNQLLRDRKVPDSVIARQCAQYQLPVEQEGWDDIVYYPTYRQENNE